MPRQGIFFSDFRVNFKLRDFFLDFLACLVPGLIYLIGATILVGGLIAIFSYQFVLKVPFTELLTRINIENGFGLFSFHFWFILTATFLAYFTGHLLYRQTPKRPDYASFLRIRKKVITEKDDWVIGRGRGVKTQDVQFPYSNLRQYLRSRGFEYLADYAIWKSHKDQGEPLAQRSKTTINKAKIRISFFFPENTLNLIRNEAHIRLASSMWYASKYTLTLSYYCIFFTLIYLWVISSDHWEFPTLRSLVIALALLSIGLLFRRVAVNRIRSFPKDNTNEKMATRRAKLIDQCWKLYDRWPVLISVSLLILLLLAVDEKSPLRFSQSLTPILLYLAIHTFILIGALFAKHRIEETLHYQRVREIVYVLETAFLARVFDEKNLPDPFEKAGAPLVAVNT